MTQKELREILTIISRALKEDIGSGDVTTECIVPPSTRLYGTFVAKQEGIIAGLEVAYQVFRILDSQVKFEHSVKDGGRVTKGEKLRECMEMVERC